MPAPGQAPFAGSRERDFAAAAVEQARANLFFQSADLRGNRRLRTEALLRGAGEAQRARHFQKRFQLIKIHIRAGTSHPDLVRCASAISPNDARGQVLANSIPRYGRDERNDGPE